MDKNAKTPEVKAKKANDGDQIPNIRYDHQEYVPKQQSNYH